MGALKIVWMTFVQRAGVRKATPAMGQLSPAALEKAGNCCSREGRVGGPILQGSIASSAAPQSARAKFVDCSRSVSRQMFCSTVSHSARKP